MKGTFCPLPRPCRKCGRRIEKPKTHFQKVCNECNAESRRESSRKGVLTRRRKK